MKRKINVAMLLVVALMISLLAFTACGNNSGNGDKQVPVYQGMTITKADSAIKLTSASCYSSGIVLLSSNNGNNGDNGNHNGHYKGDHTDRNDTIDEDNPYPDNGANENIEEEIKSSLNIIGSPDEIYYATPNEDIYINIHIDNPDSFEIMSFTLNGKKYSNYMFEEGSDMETIVLKYNVGSAAGIVEYTIDAIKYIDGTEIKDVIIDGNKTVMAGIRTENQVVASVTDVDIDTNVLSFNVNVKDNNSLVEFSKGALKAVIYDGFSIVSEQDIAIGDNSVTFNGLKTNTLYQYAIVGYYDDLSGADFGMNILYKDAFYTDPIVLFDNINIGHESITFGFSWNENHSDKTFSALKLYKGDTFVKPLSVSSTSVTELLSNTAYKLVAEYLNGSATEAISIEFTTLAKVTPEISIVNPTKTQTSVGFEISEIDADNVGAITKIELVHANGTVYAESIDQRAFANLLSNNAYTVKVTYAYNLGDGNGEQTVTKEININTDAKTVPSFTVKNDNITTNGITAEYDIADIDNILSEYKIELYKGNVLVSENDDKEIDFTGLDYYTDYMVKITYKYNLNDGNGEQTAIHNYTFKSLPYIDVTECNIANTSAVSEGETIFMSVKLDNPLGMTIESVVINGKTYDVTGASTKNKIFVEIVYNGQFAGGDTYLKIDKVNAKIDNTVLCVEPETELSDSVFINGKIEVIKIEFVNDRFEPIDWAFPSDRVYVLITLNNPTGYSIDSIVRCYNSWTTDGDTVTTLKKLDNNRWCYSINLENDGWNEQYLTALSYSNDYIEKKLNYSEMTTRCYRVASDEVKYISSPNDLKNMNGGYYYELKNDIDLAGLEWVGSGFCGVFDGKGYSIKNMSFVGTVKNSNAYMGLFSSGNGVIQNVNIEEATVIVELIADDGSQYSAYVGGIVAYADPHSILFIHNSTVDKYSIFNIKNTVGEAYAGGIIGFAADAYYGYSGGILLITNCTNHGNVSATGSKDSASAGGILGCAAGTSTILNCTNSGHISSNNIAGGIVAFTNGAVMNCANSGIVSAINSYDSADAGGIVGYAYVDSTIENCTNSGNISSNNRAGGIVAHTDGTVANCTNSGDISSSNTAGGIAGCAYGAVMNCTNSGIVSAINSNDSTYAGGIVGCAYGDSTIENCINIEEISSSYKAGGIAGVTDGAVTNCYSLVEGNAHNAETCTFEQLNSKEFYTEILGWSEDIWDFSELDVENGKYPRLK